MVKVNRNESIAAKGKTMRLQTKAMKGAVLGFGLFALVALTGCPAPEAPQTSQVTVLFTADGTMEEAKSLPASYAEKARVVMVEEILSLLVTVDEIYFERATDVGIEAITVVDEPFDLDLVNLLGITEVIDSRVGKTHGIKDTMLGFNKCWIFVPFSWFWPH